MHLGLFFTPLPSIRVVSVLILYNFTQTQKYFTLALLVLLVTNIMSAGIVGHRVDRYPASLEWVGETD